MKRKIHRSYNFFGNLVVVNFPKDFSSAEKKKFAKNILEENKSVRTILEKSGNFKGRLRKMQTKWIAGEKTKEVLYHENGCVFRFNIDDTYFSPRLSNERKEIASMIKKNERVLVMFAGVAPYPIVIAKNSPAEVVFSNEINRKANKYAELNIERNKLKNRVILIPGDIKKIITNKKLNKKFDVIVMPRPQLKDSFLEQAFNLSKKGTRIYYYDFGKESKEILEKIKTESNKFKKKIKIKEIKKAGDIAPYKFRWRVEIIVKN